MTSKKRSKRARAKADARAQRELDKENAATLDEDNRAFRALQADFEELLQSGRMTEARMVEFERRMVNETSASFTEAGRVRRAKAIRKAFEDIRRVAEEQAKRATETRDITVELAFLAKLFKRGTHIHSEVTAGLPEGAEIIRIKRISATSARLTFKAPEMPSGNIKLDLHACDPATCTHGKKRPLIPSADDLAGMTRTEGGLYVPDPS